MSAPTGSLGGVSLQSHPGGAEAFLNETYDESLALAWLGQAGFLIRQGSSRLLIDPYLSDYLAEKYAGTSFPHTRMMASPISAESIRDLDLVLCTHRHGDHMDPGSLPILARNNPGCRFVVPRAEREAAIELGLSPGNLLPMDAGEILRIGEVVSIEAVAAAHEELKVNDRGEQVFLGYILRIAGRVIYHSGDCVVYEGLADTLAARKVDLALLPVNGRSEELTRRGVLGNMSFSEACALCSAAGIGTMVAHHVGMFSFNTVDTEELRRRIAGLEPNRLRCILPEIDKHYILA